MRHGGKLLVECLEVLGARFGFGVPGESYLTVLDGMHQSPISFVNTRNEGGAAFMAAAYGKLTGSPGLCFVTRGPGATNASIGVHTAMQDSSPMIIFVGQIDTRTRDREVFQEVDYRSMFGGLAKWVTEIEHVERIPEIVSRAWAMALSGRPGPVVVALPENVVGAMTDAAAIERPPPIPAPIASESNLEQIRDALSGASRPIIMTGGGLGASGSRALERFAEAAEIPVLTVFRYHDSYDNRLPTFVGEAGVGLLPEVRESIERADLVLALNIRFGELTADNYEIFDLPDMRQTLIHVHPSAAELGKIYQPDIAVQANPDAFAAQLEKMERPGGWTEWLKDCRAR